MEVNTSEGMRGTLWGHPELHESEEIRRGLKQVACKVKQEKSGHEQKRILQYLDDMLPASFKDI